MNNNSGLRELMQTDQVQQFWTELNKSSIEPVEFLDAAVCLAAIRHLKHSEESKGRFPQG